MKPNDLHQPSLLGQMIAQATEAHLNSPAQASYFIDTRFLRNGHFVDYSRKDYFLQRGQRTYVDPLWDSRDAFLMTEWTRSGKHSKSFGRGYQRRQFCRAFHGCSSADITSEEAV